MTTLVRPSLMQMAMIIFVACVMGVTAGPALASPGDLDDTFDTDGIVTTSVGANFDSANSMAIQDDGKIVVAGQSSNGVSYDFAVARYNTDGSLDTSFSTDGIVTTSFGAGNDYGTSVAIQGDGAIVVAGYSHNGTNNDFAVARYTAAGALDTTFDADGKLTTAVGAGNDLAYGVGIQGDGMIVVAGVSSNGVDNDFALVRYDTSGALDATFDTDGIVTTDFGTTGDTAQAVVLRADDTIVVVGHSVTGFDNDFAVAQYATDGSLDTTFGGDGLVTTSFGTNSDLAYAVAVQDDDALIVAGFNGGGGNYDFALARYLTDGSLDTSFDTDGKVTTSLGGTFDEAFGVAQQWDGKIVAVGKSNAGGTYDLALARYSAAGALDTTFSGDGTAFTDVGGEIDSAEAVALQADHKIVVAGSASLSGNYDVALARYWHAPPENSDLPSISGDATNGSTLTCAEGTWTDSPTYEYEWLRDGGTIGGEVASTYTIQDADAGASITCTVTATTGGGSTAATSAGFDVLPAPQNSDLPSITGTAGVGNTLTCNDGTWSGAPTFGYQWYGDATPLGGETANTYVQAESDADTTLTCDVTAAENGFSTTATSDGFVIPAAPGNTDLPAITGGPGLGDTLTCEDGTWTGDPTFAYAWLRDAAPIGGETANTYTQQAADAGTTITCEVTATNGGGSSVEASAGLDVPAVPANTVLPAITGTTKQGSTLTCGTGTWDNAPDTYAFQWLDNLGADIVGATSNTYVVAFTYAGLSVACEVTATNGGGSDTATSAQTSISKVTGTITLRQTTSGGTIKSCGGTLSGACKTTGRVYAKGTCSPAAALGGKAVTVRFYKRTSSGAWKLLVTKTPTASGACNYSTSTVLALGKWRMRSTMAATTNSTAPTSTYRYINRV